MSTVINYLNICCQLAQDAMKQNEIPVGALIVYQDQIISQSHSLEHTLTDPTQHAEVRVIQMACHNRQSTQLTNCDLYTSLEPCLMCYQAAKLAGIRHIYYAFAETRFGIFSQGQHDMLAQSSLHQISASGPFPMCRPIPPISQFFKNKRL